MYIAGDGCVWRTSSRGVHVPVALHSPPSFSPAPRSMRFHLVFAVLSGDGSEENTSSSAKYSPPLCVTVELGG